jgi:hypothetical protein
MGYRDPNKLKPSLMEFAAAKSLFALVLLAVVIIIWAISALAT